MNKADCPITMIADLSGWMSPTVRAGTRRIPLDAFGQRELSDWRGAIVVFETHPSFRRENFRVARETCLGQLSVGFRYLIFWFTQDRCCRLLVKISTGFVRIDHLRFTGNRCCRTKLDLRVVGNDEPHALGGGEGFTDFTASDVLQVGFP